MFLRSLPIFQGFTKSYINKLKEDLTVNHYIRNAIVYRQDELWGKVYIVKEGEFKESLEVELDEDITGCESLLLEESLPHIVIISLCIEAI